MHCLDLLCQIACHYIGWRRQCMQVFIREIEKYMMEESRCLPRLWSSGLLLMAIAFGCLPKRGPVIWHIVQPSLLSKVEPFSVSPKQIGDLSSCMFNSLLLLVVLDGITCIYTRRDGLVISVSYGVSLRMKSLCQYLMEFCPLRIKFMDPSLHRISLFIKI